MAGFNLYQSNRLEHLAELFAENNSRTPLPPLEKERVLVQSIGMGRWLSLFMAEEQGVWASFSYLYPNILLDDVFKIIFPDYISAQDAGKTEMQWRIFSALPKFSKDEAFAALKGYSSDPESLKLFQLAGKCADLFDQYITGRPDMICEWDKGSPSIYAKGQWTPLEKKDLWQYLLWREISCKEKKPQHRAEHRRKLPQVILTEEMIERLPKRLSAFGISTLFPFHLDILVYLSSYIDVSMYVLSPSREYIADMQSGSVKAKIARRLIASGNAAAADLSPEANPLTASMGKLAGDFQRMFLERDAVTDVTKEDDFICTEPATLLENIQRDILDSIPLNGIGEKRVISGLDGSIEIQSCYGPMREVEALYDRMLGLLNDDESLEPRDILVMTTDIDVYAPYIDAVFGGAKNEGRKRFIPFSIADRNIRRQGNTIEAFKKILFLSDERFTASSVLDIAAVPAVAGRFGFSEEALGLISSYLLSSGINWGRNESDREEACGAAFRQNSWDYGIERLLLGYAAGNEEALFGGILPASGAADNVAVFSSFLDFYRKLSDLASWSAQSHSPSEWNSRLTLEIGRFFAENPDNAWELSAMRSALAEISEGAEKASFNEDISLRLACDAFFSRLDDKAAQYGFLNGRVTFCALLPMRSIPFRIICVLGLDDGVFPGTTRLPSFDLAGRYPQTGDRSKRNDDRYIFLETILSARQKLILSYNGRNPYDGSARQPSVLVSELIDYISKTFTADAGADIAKFLVREHRLHPFSRAYFDGSSSLRSYSGSACAVASASVIKSGLSQFIDKNLDVKTQDEGIISPDEFIRFFKNASKYFCKKILSLSFPYDDPAVSDDEPFEINFGEKIHMEEHLLARRLSGDTADYYPLFSASGILPPEKPGERIFRGIEKSISSFAGRIRPYYEVPAEKFDADIPLNCKSGSLRIRGELNDVRQGLVLSRLKMWDSDIITLWIGHLCLCAGGMNAVSRFLCEDSKSDIVLSALSQDKAVSILNSLSELYFSGMSKPLCFFPKTSKAYYDSITVKMDEAKARKDALAKWIPSEFTAGGSESEDPYFSLCFDREAADPELLFTGEFEKNARLFFEPVNGCLEALK